MKTDIVRELKNLAEQNDGVLLPEAVVEAAKPADSPLHSRFEWNNAKAGHSYRLWQARHLIRVCVETLPQTKEPVEVFVSLTSDRKEGGYRVQTEVLNDREMRRQLLADALAELRCFAAKYARLKQLAKVMCAIRVVLKKAG
jgi:predicted MarR family transcription regulator